MTATRLRPPHTEDPSPQRPSLGEGVLLVDDHRLQREWHAELLRGLGVERLFEAADGEQALQLLRALDPPPALLLLDLEMPRMDGFETLRQLAIERHQVVVVVVSGGNPAVFTALPALADELGVALLGALPKPIDLAKLSAVLERLPDTTRRPARPLAAPADIDAAALRHALAAGWIVADYQPKVHLQQARVDGVEALARWREPDGRSLSPGQFIPLAEREGLIDTLTLHMLDCVGRDFRREPALASSALRVSINVSAQSLSVPGFAEQLRAHVERCGLPPARFVFEITESALASDPAVALCALGRLRLQGFGLALDDYGTGFSSLQQLARMPFSELKIDRSFVRHADLNERQCTILASAIDIGRRLGLDTVAEGVESIEELQLLRRFGCSHAQGHLLARPLAVPALIDWLARGPAPLAALFAGTP